MTNSTTFLSSLALCGLVAVLTSGCKQSTHCAELRDCGGDIPSGSWQLTPPTPVNGNLITPASCNEDLYTPASDPRLVGGAPVPAARLPPPEPAVYDWCDMLITNSGLSIQTHAANFYAESAPVGAATVRLQKNGVFSAGLTVTGTYTLNFPALCMREFGAMDGRAIDPSDPSLGTGDVCQQLQVPLRAAGVGDGADINTTCSAQGADPGGCICKFDVQAAGGPSGYFRQISANTIQFLPNANFPQTVTYCNSGDGSLDLTGADGEYLFGVAGLRTLRLAQIVPNCADGQQGPNEDGVDCGGLCPTACTAAPPGAAGAGGMPAATAGTGGDMTATAGTGGAAAGTGGAP